MTQLTDLFKGLMFLHGHFTRPDDLEAATAPAATAPPAAPASTPGPAAEPAAGRPADTRRHNLDQDEPFEWLPAGNDAARAPVCAACG